MNVLNSAGYLGSGTPTIVDNDEVDQPEVLIMVIDGMPTDHKVTFNVVRTAIIEYVLAP